MCVTSCVQMPLLDSGVSSQEAGITRGKKKLCKLQQIVFLSSNVDGWAQFAWPASRGRRTHCNGAPPILRLWSGAGGERRAVSDSISSHLQGEFQTVCVCVCVSVTVLRLQPSPAARELEAAA